MADVTYTFAADDTFMMMALRRQEQAVAKTAATIEGRYAQAAKGLDKFVFGSARLGQAAAAGIAAGGYIMVDLIKDYAAQNRDVARSVADLGKAWNGLRMDHTRDIIGDGESIRSLAALVQGIRDYRRELLGLERSGAGLLGLGATMIEDPNYDRAIDAQKATDAALANLQRSSVSRRLTEEASRGQDVARWDLLRMNGMTLRADREQADAERDRRAQELRQKVQEANLAGTPIPPAAVDEGFRTIEAQHRVDLSQAERREEEDLLRIRERNGQEFQRQLQAQEQLLRDQVTYSARAADAAILAIFEADEAERRAGIQADTLRAGSMRARGLEKEADLLEAQISYQERLLDIENNRMVSEEARSKLGQAAAGLLAAQIAEIEARSGRTTGGRGIDAGIASSPGVISGGLVSTARDNPAVMIQKTNQLLERILQAVSDPNGAVFSN